MRHPVRCVAALVLHLWSATVPAQSTFPIKPIRIVIGTPAGGGSDLMARTIGQFFTQAWAQQAVLDPRPGASGNIAAEHVAKSPPDGYTLYVCYGTHTVNPSIYPRVGYDPIKDFTPISLIATQYNALVVHPSVPAKTVKELVAIAKARPGKMSYSSSGNGSPNHLGMELFKMGAKIDIVHIPYKGAAPSRIDFLGGHVDVMFDVLRTALPYHEAGRARILAVGSEHRSSLAPNIPTVDESGYKGIVVRTWHALLAPAATPPTIVEQLQNELRRGLFAPPAKEKLARDGIEVVASTPGELDAFMRADIIKWKNVVQAAHIRAD
ncbi:MAG TPA: tripartite tricarboxylate transporter substrate binding protein [Burkholderiales bacterium]|nr:tripartite tricarboxylate transporter substrate binding protein [Burkholderiales bacterium]